jgi:SAM-dependent methyltransferase
MPSTSKRPSSAAYDDRFFEAKNEGSYASAKAILPLVFSIVVPRSVVDVGCGSGTWLKAAEELGVRDYHGYNGSQPTRLFVPADRFTVADLARPLRPERRFDLAICCEVAEHLPPDSAAVLIASLTSAADVVLFSAAIPGQGGTHHVNEQWPSYWQKLFLRHHYSAYDFLRPRIWNDRAIEWWYRQNAVLYVAEHAASRFALLPRTHEVLALVHPELYESSRRKKTWRTLLRGSKRAIDRT